MGLSDKSQFSYLLDVEEKGTPIYYSNLIVSALNGIGFNLQNCVQSKIVVNNFRGLNLALPKEDIKLDELILGFANLGGIIL